MARKARKKEEDVDSYRHGAETRKNAVPVGLASYDTSKPNPKKYDYDPHLDPHWYGQGRKSIPPFKLGKEKRIAVKVIDHRGNEVMAVRR